MSLDPRYHVPQSRWWWEVWQVQKIRKKILGLDLQNQTIITIFKFRPSTWFGFQEMVKWTTILSWYASGIGVSEISKSSCLQHLVISNMDFEHIGQESLLSSQSIQSQKQVPIFIESHRSLYNIHRNSYKCKPQEVMEQQKLATPKCLHHACVDSWWCLPFMWIVEHVITILKSRSNSM